ncbi:B12-binding domain-containing radical SAM protein [Fusibacter bizertensis]
MKILLMSLNSKYIHTNLAIRYLKNYIKCHMPNHNSEIIIKEYTINNEMDYVLRDISKDEYDYIFASAYIWNIESLSILFSNFRQINQHTKIIFGGPEVTYNAEVQMQKHLFLDAIVIGEGEQIFLEWIEALETMGENLAFEKTKGIVYRYDNQIYVNERMPLIENLDVIPFAYDEVLLKGSKILYYESSRGCPFNCSYCLSSAEKGVRYFSIDRVIEDLDIFLKYKVPQVKFVDRTFNAKKTHALAILNYLIDNDNGITNFHFEITASLLDRDYYEVLEKSRQGLFQFEVGIQTTYQPTIHAIHRPIDFDKVKKACLHILKMGGIHLHVDLIAGLPFETYDRFLDSFNEVYLIGADQLQLGFLKILEGTRIQSEIAEHGYLIRVQAPYEVLQNKYISFKEITKLKEIESLVEYYHNSGKFIHSLKYIMKNCNISPSDFYLKLAAYFNENSYFDAPVGTYRLYEILAAFYDKHFSNLELFLDLLKVDYHYANLKGQKALFNYIEVKNFNNLRTEFLNDLSFRKEVLQVEENMTTKQLLKNVEFITLGYDIMALIKSDYKEVKKRVSIVLYDYSHSNYTRMLDIDYSKFVKEGEGDQ